MLVDDVEPVVDVGEVVARLGVVGGAIVLVGVDNKVVAVVGGG